MKVIVTASARFDLTPDGVLWTENASLRHRFWTRYLDVFDEVRLLVRARKVLSPPEGWAPASGDGVVPVPVPYFVGPAQMLRKLREVRRVIRAALGDGHALALRLPCTIGTEAWRAKQVSQPYGAEVVGDPWDVFSPGAIRHPLRPFFRWSFSRCLRRLCSEACAVAYVTEQSLQRRYPPRPDAFTTSYSSIELPAAALASRARPPRENPGSLTLIHVGTLVQLYKAPDVLVEAFRICVETIPRLRLVLVGEGAYRPELEARVATLGLTDWVEFTGQLFSGEDVRARLDQADLFVLPSRMEGLPRAMIEAMARALPCIGSTVGGIPELLPAEDLVPPGDAMALAAKIREVVTDQDRMARMSARNLERSKLYQEDNLRRRRNFFYQYIKNQTELWISRRCKGLGFSNE